VQLKVRFRFQSLRTRLISSYLVILGIGGLATSIVGSGIVSTTIAREARRSVDRGIGTARLVYEEQLRLLERTVGLATSGITIQHHLAAGDTRALRGYLEEIRQCARLDFVGLIGPDGRVLLRVPQSTRSGDDVSSVGVVKAALGGQPAVGADVLPAEALEREDPELAGRARIRLVPTAHSAPATRTEETSGIVLLAAAPLQSEGGALYAGVLLNRNFGIVDRVWETVFRGDPGAGQEFGSVTVFENDVRIATTIRNERGERVVGTRASAEVSQAVLSAGKMWRGRAFVVRDWYVSSYEPLRDYGGRVIGMLYVGVLESAYTDIRNRVILSFFAIATVGFILIIGVTYYMIRSITGPLAKMAASTEKIAAGRFDEEVPPDAVGEIAHLAKSFNTMLASLRQMKADLEEWGRTLEEKVKQRSDELVSMQARVAQSERLASLGLLAAGVAHEINNPLGAILALAALTLEETAEGDPDRENLAEVVKQAQRCRDIVRGLLDFSRQSRITTEPVDLNAILTDTLSLVAQQAPFFNIVVTKKLGTDLPPMMGDKSQLQQVFLNIIMNAVEAMQEKGSLALTTLRVDDSIETRITDSGPGIPCDMIDRIFDPFFTTKESRRGTGLGLSIAYGIVRKHNGTIAVESEPGRGTTFVVRLPVSAPLPQETH